MLRTCGGIKRRIIETILNLDVDTFRAITNIYQASELNTNTDIYRELYKYTLKSERVWPKNLFIKLQDFCKFLKMQSISVPEAANALMYISPRFLHWSDLRENTNIMENVKLYRLKHTYKHLNVTDMQEVEMACSDYYDRCWTVDDWILDVPLIAKDLMNMVFVTGKFTLPINQFQIHQVL